MYLILAGLRVWGGIRDMQYRYFIVCGSLVAW
jgi:hypothetical protein